MITEGARRSKEQGMYLRSHLEGDPPRADREYLRSEF